jgi:hypothetical protein
LIIKTPLLFWIANAFAFVCATILLLSSTTFFLSIENLFNLVLLLPFVRKCEKINLKHLQISPTKLSCVMFQQTMLRTNVANVHTQICTKVCSIAFPCSQTQNTTTDGPLPL